MRTKARCDILATKVGWRIRDSHGRMLTITEIDQYGYRWCDCIKGKDKFLQKFTVTGQPLLNASDYGYAVKVFPPTKAVARFLADTGYVHGNWR